MPTSPRKAFFGKKFRKYLVVSKKGRTFAPAFEKHAPVAQLVEHLTLNQGVQGSNPCGCTKRKRNLPLFCCLPMHYYRLCFHPLEASFLTIGSITSRLWKLPFHPLERNLPLEEAFKPPFLTKFPQNFFVSQNLLVTLRPNMCISAHYSYFRDKILKEIWQKKQKTPKRNCNR